MTSQITKPPLFDRKEGVNVFQCISMYFYLIIPLKNPPKLGIISFHQGRGRI